MSARSVHNTRVERLWYDITEGFGWKWKTFFHDLETHYRLDPTLQPHLWLLHHLFLAHINHDAQEWVHAWNSHTLALRDEPNRSPQDLWFFGMIQEGPRGLGQLIAERDSLTADEIASYGVDWDSIDDPQLMAHFVAQNASEFDSIPPSSAERPGVHIQPPAIPFEADLATFIDHELLLR